MKLLALALACSSALAEEAAAPKTVDYTTPAATSSAHLFETFDGGLPDSFVKTSGNKQDEEKSKYSGEIVVEAAQKNALVGDLGLVLKNKAKHHAIAANLAKPFVFTDAETFVAQYEVNFQSGVECAGAYVKLFAEDDTLDLKNFDDKTRFTFMFGPDKCASDYKLHFIYNYQNPKTGEFEEKHLKTKPKTETLKSAYGDANPHLYRLVVNKDNTFAISLDGSVISKGNLLDDLKPSINPEKEVVDKDDTKPEDWDDREKIDDPDAAKPEDWDESAPKKIVDDDAVMPKNWREDMEPLMNDPEATKPDDWDDEMDGEYTPPQIDNPECKDISGCGAWEKPMKDNPAYKGKWVAKKIKNPEYKGVWKPRTIANPDYFEDATPFASASTIKAMAIEVWTMSENIMFDNFYIGTSEIDADTLAASTIELKKKQAKLNEPSLMEKASKAAEDNKWVVYLISALVGIPVLYLLWSKTRKSEPEVPAPEPEVEEEDEGEEGEDATNDPENEELEESKDPVDNEESESGSDEASASESEEEVKTDNVRKRSNRRKAD